MYHLLREFTGSRCIKLCVKGHTFVTKGARSSSFTFGTVIRLEIACRGTRMQGYIMQLYHSMMIIDRLMIAVVIEDVL